MSFGHQTTPSGYMKVIQMLAMRMTNCICVALLSCLAISCAAAGPAQHDKPTIIYNQIIRHIDSSRQINTDRASQPVLFYARMDSISKTLIDYLVVRKSEAGHNLTTNLYAVWHDEEGRIQPSRIPRSLTIDFFMPTGRYDDFITESLDVFRDICNQRNADWDKMRKEAGGDEIEILLGHPYTYYVYVNAEANNGELFIYHSLATIASGDRSPPHELDEQLTKFIGTMLELAFLSELLHRP